MSLPSRDSPKIAATPAGLPEWGVKEGRAIYAGGAPKANQPRLDSPKAGNHVSASRTNETRAGNG